jgi:hypothetical protein
MHLIITFALHQEWFCGREARHGSAKAPTPVRIRSEPLQKKPSLRRLFCFYQHLLL